MPSDSTMTTTMTRHIVAIETGSNFGMPNCSGVTMANQAASSVPAKLTLPISIDTMKPTMMPTSTETLARKPLPKRVTTSTTTSTMVAISRLSGAP